MKAEKNSRGIKYLAGYYGILQTGHLILLIRAVLIVSRAGNLPFPALPPEGGWPLSSLPFLFGMGAADGIAILSGLFFVYQLLIKDQMKFLVGLVSLTIALSSGLVYLVGTLPSGAWTEHLASYLIVVFIFSPILPLAVNLFKTASSALNQNPDAS